jgi:heptaprenylglyceryl phosphate synthase
VLGRADPGRAGNSMRSTARKILQKGADAIVVGGKATK